MGRYRKNKGLAKVLVVLPWQVSAGFAGVGFAVLRWVIPSIFSRNPVLAGLAAMAHSATWLALIGFGCISMIAFARAKARVNSVATNTTGRPSQRKSIEPPITAFLPDMGKVWRNGTQLEAGWGNAVVGAAGQTAIDIAPDAWSLEALRALEWKRFELLCAKYYEAVGFKSQTIRCGAHGGIDIKLFKGDPNKPLRLQAQAANVRRVARLVPWRQSISSLRRHRLQRQQNRCGWKTER